MNNIELMNVLNTTNDLLEYFAGFRLRDSAIMKGLLFALNDIIEELSALHVFHDEKQLLWGFDDFVQLNDTRMTDELQDMNLSTDALHICHIDDFLLL